MSSGDGQPGGDPSGNGERPRARPRRRRWIAVAAAFVVAVAVFAALIAVGYLQAYRVYQKADAALPLLQRARASLALAKLPAGDPLGRASAIAGAAAEQVDHPGFPMRLAGAIPFLNRPVRAVRLGVGALDLETRAGLIVRDVATQVLGAGATGSGSRLFSNGAVNVALLQRAAGAVGRVRTDLLAAQRDIEAIPSIPFTSRVATLKSKALAESHRAVALVTRASSYLGALPSFLGSGGRRTYLVALENNSDQRATGGALLAYALVRVDRGRMRLVRGGSILSIDRKHGVPVPFPPAVRWYLRNTGVPARMNNGVNYTPDFPVVAETWARQIRVLTGVRVDGVLAMDPHAVAAALTGDPPFSVPGVPGTITAQDIVPLVEIRQYSLAGADQRALPGLLIRRALTAVTHPSDPLATMRALAGALATKRLQLWSAHPGEQALFHRLGWDGALRSAAGDYAYLVDEKRASNKVDYFTRTSVQDTVTILSDGTARVEYRVTLENRTPPGLPRAIVGPWSPYALNVAMLNLYVPADARLLSVQPLKSPTFKYRAGFFQHVESRFRVFTQTIQAWPGHPGTLVLRYEVPHAVVQTPAGPVYRLTVQHQPLAHPASLTVTLRLPAGASVRSASRGWTVRGNVATLRQELVRDFTTQVAFTP